jgi:hypothetical protein
MQARPSREGQTLRRLRLNVTTEALSRADAAFQSGPIGSFRDQARPMRCVPSMEHHASRALCFPGLQNETGSTTLLNISEPVRQIWEA